MRRTATQNFWGYSGYPGVPYGTPLLYREAPKSFLIYRDSDNSKKSLLLDEARILKFLIFTEASQDNACSRMADFSL